MLEIDLGVDTRFAGAVKEVRDEREWVAIFLGDFVEAAEIDA